MNQDKPRLCPACREAELQSATRMREFRPHGRDVRVELLTSRCPACGTEATSATQHAENLSRLKARKAEYDGLLLGEEILALRRRYGITQQAAAKIFGKGKIAFSRYENETSYPDESTTLLLELAIQKPDVVRLLADKAAIDLPLWGDRCEDERKHKLRVIADVQKVDPEVSGWAKGGAVGRLQRAIGQNILRMWATDVLEHPSSEATVNDDQYSMRAVAYA